MGSEMCIRDSLFAVPHAEIKDLTVALTMVGGRVTYRRPAR